MNSYEKNTVIEKFEHYFDGVAPFDLGRVMVAVPTIRHRAEMTINRLNCFPNRFIFIEQSELELYKPEIDSGWNPVIRTAFNLNETRNQILQRFRDSKFEFLLMPDDEIRYRKVFVQNDTFQSAEVNELEEPFKLELARMERDNIDVLTIPSSQYLTARVTDTVIFDKPAIDYSFILLTKRAIVSNNYWYTTASRTCEDLIMAKLLLADPTLKCRLSVLLRRDAQLNNKGTNTYGDKSILVSWMDRTIDLLGQLSARGFIPELMDKLWSPEHRPIKHYPLNYKRHKTYFQEKQDISKWKGFLK